MDLDEELVRLRLGTAATDVDTNSIARSSAAYSVAQTVATNATNESESTKMMEFPGVNKISRMSYESTSTTDKNTALRNYHNQVGDNVIGAPPLDAKTAEAKNHHDEVVANEVFLDKREMKIIEGDIAKIGKKIRCFSITAGFLLVSVMILFGVAIIDIAK